MIQLELFSRDQRQDVLAGENAERGSCSRGKSVAERGPFPLHEAEELTGFKHTRPDETRGYTRQARARWLADQIRANRLTRHAIADALAIDLPDVDALLAGRTTTISHSAWRRLADLAQ
jgi:hypothetical protein